MAVFLHLNFLINIALAYDFEELSEKLILEGLRFAECMQGQVYLIHISSPDPHLLSYQLGREKAIKNRKAELRAEHRILDRIAQRFTMKGIQCEVLVEEGATIKELQGLVKKIKADYLLIGHHRDKGFLRTYLNSSARKLIDKIEVPLMVVPLMD